MALPWPTIAQVGGEMPPEDQQAIRDLLDAFGDRLAELLEAQGIQRFAAILFRPFNLVCVRDAEKIVALFSAVCRRNGRPEMD
jgi:hypothetical protein